MPLEAGVNIPQAPRLVDDIDTVRTETTDSGVHDKKPTPAELAEVNVGETQPLSKKAQKRAAKQAYLVEKKLERRVREKEAKKEKKRQRRERQERIAAGEEVSEDDELVDIQPEKKKARRDGPSKPFNARVVVDLGFDDLMSEKEINSLASQLAYTYSANRKAHCPFSSILFTSLEKRTRQRLDSLNEAGYQRWVRTEWWEQGYDRLWTEGDAGVVAGVKEGSSRSKSEIEKVVYLTADANEELEELKEDETYIIGGICDHNRYKNLCLNKAKKEGIRSARLPIGRYLAQMTTRKVLTVNQVFEILVHWTESRDWEEALYSVVPKRKFEQGGTTRQAVARSVSAPTGGNEGGDGPVGEGNDSVSRIGINENA